MTEKTAEEIAAEAKAAEKAKIAAERASIKADVGQKMLTPEEKEVAAAEEAKEVEAAKAAEVEAAKVEAEAKVDDKEEEIEDLEAAKDAAKTDREKDKFQKRIDRETAKRKALEAEIKDLKAKLAADPDKANALTEEEVETRAEAKAAQKQMVRDFEAASDRLFKAGVKADKEFQAKINALAEDIGKIPGHMIGILDDLDNGGEVLSYFTNNADEAEEIYAMSPAKAAVKLAKLSAKLETEKKPKPKEISKVPDPSETIKGGSSSPDVLPKDPTNHMADWVRIRNKQAETRRKEKMGLH
jgi:chromosome segregation ATPase